MAHSVKVSAANVHDVRIVGKLLTGKEIYADSGYLGAERREEVITENIPDEKIKCKINKKVSQSKIRLSKEKI